MYFPYLRGKQFELIALRNLSENYLISDKTIPIIEPVKLSSTLISTIQEFIKRKNNIGIVINPQVGAFQEDIEESKNDTLYDKYKELLNDENIIKTYIMNEDSEEEIPQIQINDKLDSIIVCINDIDYLETYEKYFCEDKPKYTLIKDESSFRRKIKDSRVISDDKFNKRARNIDYLKKEDEFFSDDHIYFKDDGYIGFSDFSVVGSEYKDTGFAPFAVAIHIHYFDDESNLRIRHFVSNSNEDIQDPAGKFGEALKKLIEWSNNRNIKETEGLKEFKRLYKESKYSGLGVVKKLSIMHHLELVNEYLETTN
ncbi:sce7725 family protein [Senegalia massiliensis]|uniref:Sce7725 family protein n=1 Tax=Senegalia massiliensis TaxID=1720316 RepID=A0A845QYN5_9CLOT|nr:sce7725 family protein [Senegalia massiliensis]NBI08077.1 hypothetical protein [Senegalia massiliensis]